MVNLSGVAGAGPLWHDFMRQALSGKPETDFVPPPGLVRAEVCSPSGLLPTPECPRTHSELFLEGTAPAEPDNLYQTFKIDSRTGGLADASTPREFVMEKVFLVLPPEAQEWARANGLPQPPDSGLGSLDTGLVITSPDPNTVYQISPRLPLESQQVPWRVTAGEPLSAVTFVLDAQAVATVTQPPFEWWWTLQPGAHTLRARGQLASGETVESEAMPFVVNP
jgi:membrane carboxypeptidase/penicillin-binding protein PbpC